MISQFPGDGTIIYCYKGITLNQYHSLSKSHTDKTCNVNLIIRTTNFNRFHKHVKKFMLRNPFCLTIVEIKVTFEVIHKDFVSTLKTLYIKINEFKCACKCNSEPHKSLCRNFVLLYNTTPPTVVGSVRFLGLLTSFNGNIMSCKNDTNVIFVLRD